MENVDPEEVKEESLRDVIENSIEEVAEKEAVKEAPEETPAPKEARERDENGQFKKASKEKDLGEAAPTNAPTQAEELVEAPHFWDAAKKEQFRTLPRDIQQIIAEQDRLGQRYQTQLQQQLAQERRNLEEQMREVQPWIQVRDTLAQNSKLGLLQLANQLNVDPQDLVEYAQQSNSNPMLDSVNQRMQQFEQYLSSQTAALEEQKVASIESEVQQYANEVDENGTLLRPYFEPLYLEMMPLVAAIRAQNPNASHKQVLDAAYDRAMWGNPQVRQAELEKRGKEEESRRVQEAKEKANAARRAGSSISGSPAGTLTQASPTTLRAQLEQAFNEY